MMFDAEMVGNALELATGRQHRYDQKPRGTKIRAKWRAAEIVGSVAKPKGRFLDVGGEMFYLPAFHAQGMQLECVNLDHGSDMHDLRAEAEYDGALAMHVLEHSPMPLVVLLALRRAIRQGGFLYVAAPHPSDKWISHEAHFTVLPPDGWARLLNDAGWTVTHRETGKFGKVSIEERFLCR